MTFRDLEDKSQDEIDAVINQLAVNYKPLAVCSQVSKRWHGRCRQQGFRRAKLAELDGLQYSDWFPSLDGVLDSFALTSVSSTTFTQQAQILSIRNRESSG